MKDGMERAVQKDEQSRIGVVSVLSGLAGDECFEQLIDALEERRVPLAISIDANGFIVAADYAYDPDGSDIGCRFTHPEGDIFVNYNFATWSEFWDLDYSEIDEMVPAQRLAQLNKLFGEAESWRATLDFYLSETSAWDYERYDSVAKRIRSEEDALDLWLELPVSLDVISFYGPRFCSEFLPGLSIGELLRSEAVNGFGLEGVYFDTWHNPDFWEVLPRCAIRLHGDRAAFSEALRLRGLPFELRLTGPHARSRVLCNSERHRV